MKRIRVEVTQEELHLLTTLASDQMFRRQFIDPKMPGYKADPAELAIGKDLVLRLRELARQAADPESNGNSKRTPMSRSAHSGNSSGA